MKRPWQFVLQIYEPGKQKVVLNLDIEHAKDERKAVVSMMRKTYGPHVKWRTRAIYPPQEVA